MSIFMIAAISAKSQTKPLDLFKPLIGKVWEGHYVNSEDSIYTHHIEWIYLLGSRAVKESKIVDELDFVMDTYYYYDWGEKHIAFLSLLNKDMVSSGRVVIEESIIKLYGINYFDGGSQEFSKTFQLNDKGVLTDMFFRKKGEKWIRGHIIEYK